MNKIIIKFLWLLKPIIEWFDHTFTSPWSVKKINFDEYYYFKDQMQPGFVFVTDTYGQGSNLINPSKGKHGAIYFGKGFKSYLESLLEIFSNEPQFDQKKLERLKNFYNTHQLSDDIPYVIEALGKGVTVTSLGKFMTTKDKLKCFKPKFASAGQMNIVISFAVEDLGLGYDWGFSEDDNYKYCFEVVIDAYKKVFPNIEFKSDTVLGHRFYLANAFYDETLWEKLVDL